MGLSIVISSGIMSFALLYVVLSFSSLVDNTTSISSASSSMADIDNIVSKTVINVSSIDSANNNLVLFTISNNGTTKLWDYQKFTVIITYDSGGTNRLTEVLAYEKSCTSTLGKWCNYQIINDIQDPTILNPGEKLQIQCALSNNTSPLSGASTKLVQIVISTDNGVTATKSVML